jgi:flagellar biogenesis protein FliO
VVGSGPRRLQLVETVSLGEKRFVAVIHVDGARLLIGGSSSSVSLLTELKPIDSFDRVMTKAKAKRKPAVRRKEKAA